MTRRFLVLAAFVVGVSIAFWLALLCPRCFAGDVAPAKCGDRTWLPYEDDDGFGYREWVCQQLAGHAGRHSGWLGEPEYAGEAVGV